MARRNPSSNSPEHPRMIAARLRERQALQLRARGMDISVIAEQLEVTPQGAGKIIKRALAALQADTSDLEERRQMMQVRIDQRRLAANQVYARPHPLFHNGRLVHDDDGQTVDDDGVKLSALDRLRAADRDEADLWGLNAAQKFQHSLADPEDEQRRVWVEEQNKRIERLRGHMPAIDAASTEVREA